MSISFESGVSHRRPDILHEFKPSLELENGHSYEHYGVKLEERGGIVRVHTDGRVSSVVMVVQNGEPDPHNNAHGSYELHGTNESPDKPGQVFEGLVPGVKEGTVYNFTVERDHDTPYGTETRLHQNILDPFALATTRPIESDSGGAGAHQYSYVVDKSKLPNPIERPLISPTQRVIYEAHIKGMTALLDVIPEELRGTYLGLCSEPVIKLLKEMGFTTIEVMPPHEFSSNNYTLELGKTNYFGYGNDSWHSMHHGYTAGDKPDSPIMEFADMINVFHENGIEVIVDVVYNHTGENNALEILGHEDYYMFDKWSNPVDLTGCHQSIDAYNPASVDLIISSMRSFARMGVDGFRFDLMGAITTDSDHNTAIREHPLFKAIREDPLLSDRLMTGEPWTGTTGYSNFAPGDHFGDHGISIWWGRFRDVARKAFIQHKSVDLYELGGLLAGSMTDPEMPPDRMPNVINFVNAHDGFTLRDTTEYNHKRNEANGEGNRDGADNNNSNNHGLEGPITKETQQNPHYQEIEKRRGFSRLNAMAAVALANGTPMFPMGTEYGHTNNGNNNPWNQDTNSSYFSWEKLRNSEDPITSISLAGMRRIIRIRQKNNNLNISKSQVEKDFTWFNKHGQPLDDNSRRQEQSLIGMRVEGGKNDGQTIINYINNSDEPIEVSLPPLKSGHYVQLFDPSDIYREEEPVGSKVVVLPHSIAVIGEMKHEFGATLPHAA